MNENFLKLQIEVILEERLETCSPVEAIRGFSLTELLQRLRQPELMESQVFEIAHVTAQYLETFLIQNNEDCPPCYDDVIKDDYRKISALKTIFPIFDLEVILRSLRAQKYNFASTFDVQLKLKLISLQ